MLYGSEPLAQIRYSFFFHKKQTPSKSVETNEISGLENAEITESVTNNKPYDNYMKEVKALVPEEKQESFISIIKEALNKICIGWHISKNVKLK